MDDKNEALRAQLAERDLETERLRDKIRWDQTALQSVGAERDQWKTRAEQLFEQLRAAMYENEHV